MTESPRSSFTATALTERRRDEILAEVERGLSVYGGRRIPCVVADLEAARDRIRVLDLAIDHALVLDWLRTDPRFVVVDGWCHLRHRAPQDVVAEATRRSGVPI